MRKIGFIIFILLSLELVLLSNDRDIRFRHISLEQGLSQSLVYCMLQDSKGFMWFGTQDGLNKYDGYTFKVYRPDPKNPNSLSHNIIFRIHEDHSGVLWIGTSGDGLNKFNRDTETFTHFRNQPGVPTSLSFNFVTAIHEDRTGVLWVGTLNGLNKFHAKTGTFTRYTNIAANPYSLSNNVVNVIYEDPSGVLWIGTNGGFNKFDPNAEKFFRFRQESGDRTGLSSNIITAICEDHSGEFWIGTLDGLNRFDSKTGSYTVYRFNPDNPRSLSSSNVASIYEDHAGVLWIGTIGGGLNTFDRRKEGFVHYRPDPNNPNSLRSELVSTIYEDRSGLLWIGTMDKGINLFDRESEKFKRYRTDPTNPNSLSHNFVYSFFEDRSGVLWVGTNGGGLNKYDRESRKFTHYRTNSSRLSSDAINYVYEDSSGLLWIGTVDAGLDRFDMGTYTFKNYRRRSNDPLSLSNNNVKVIHEDSSSILWVGTLGGGLNKFDREKEQFYLYRNIPSDPYSLSDNFIRSIYEDRDHQMWIGTANGGLNKFDRKTGKFTRYQRNLDDPNSLSSNNVQAICQDSSGMLWLGTFGGGLNKFDPGKDACTHYREKDGLPNDVVYGILFDEKGYLWLSTNQGISKFDPRTETFKNYTYKDGLQSNEFNGGSYHKSKSGQMFFGGVNGFNSFYPDEVKDNKNIPPIVITDFQIFNKSVGIGCDSPLKKHITETREIKLPYNKNVFSFNFVALDYTIPEKNQYRYMMKGFDKDWVTTDSTKRYASYTNLDPREYMFKVKGSNNDGIWNEEGTSIKIVITPPYWQTWWFKVIVALLVSLLVFIFYKIRMRVISQKMRLEAQLQIAHAAQMSIMPQSDPQILGFDISGICVPAYEVGGDFFDYIWLNPEKTRFGIAIGDVSGKAMKAAMTAVMSSGMLYSKADYVTSVKEIMTQVNRPLYLKTDKRMFTALCLASLDIRTGELVFANAGLTEPLLKSRNATSYLKSVGPRVPLGSFLDSTYQETKYKLNPGDMVVFFTDGIPDAQNRDEKYYGYDTLKNLVKRMDTNSLSASEVKNNIIEDVKEFSGTAPQNDDITIVVLKFQKTIYPNRV